VGVQIGGGQRYFEDLSQIATIIIPLHLMATIPKTKRLEIDRVGDAVGGLHRASMKPLISQVKLSNCVQFLS